MEGTSWRWVGWLEQYPLNKSTVLDYFKHSDFYDRQCNNEVLAMQQQQQHLMDPSRIKFMVGIEYEVESGSASTYYLLRKQKRTSPTEVEVLALYYVLGEGPEFGTIFPLPSINRVLSTNLSSAVYYLTESLRQLKELTQDDSSIQESRDPRPTRHPLENMIDEILSKEI